MTSNIIQNGQRSHAVIDIAKPVLFPTGGLEFTSLTYTVTKKKKVEGKWVKQEVDLLNEISGYAPKGCVTAVMGPSGAGKSTFLDGLAGRIASRSLKGRVCFDGMVMSPSLIKRGSAYVMQEDRLFPMLTVYETFLFAADFRLGNCLWEEKKERVEKLIDQLGLSSSRNTYIGDQGTRGISGGERRRVSIGVDIIHGPSLLFLDEPTSGLDSTSAHSVIEKVHHIARSGSTVILTIHQPSSRIQLLLDHLIILARGQLMYQGSPQDVTRHLNRMGRRVPKGESPVEYFIDVVQGYDQSELGVEVLAEFAITGKRPPVLSEEEISAVYVAAQSPGTPNIGSFDGDKRRKGKDTPSRNADFDHSVRSPFNNTGMSWSGSHSGIVQTLKFTSTSQQKIEKVRNPMSSSPGYYTYSSEIVPGTPTPHSSDYTVSEKDYMSPTTPTTKPMRTQHLNPKFSNSFLSETWILMRRNFKNIRRTPELFLSRLVVLTIMGFMMATMFLHPKKDTQGITDRLSFFIFTVCLFFFSSNDAVPAFIQERFIFIRETSHNAYRASSYIIAGLITYLPFLALQATVYTLIVWKALSLEGSLLYLLLVLYVSLLSTNSFVVFVSSVVPNYILGYAAVIAFTALFFLFCGYFLNSHDIPSYWKWMNKISTMTYPYEGLLINEFRTEESFGSGLRGIDILKSLQISTEEWTKWENILIMLGWAVFYRILFYIVLRFFSKNERK